MTRPSGGNQARNAIPLLLVIAVLAAVFAPSAFGFSGGITTDDAAFDPLHGGCAAAGCHGGEAFATQGAGIDVMFTDAEGKPLDSIYQHGMVYSVTITLDEQNVPSASNRAGFNFFIDAGKLEASDDTARVTAAGNEATHTGAGFTTWNFMWTAPDEGAATWRLYVNDVDGSSAPDAPDQVYLQGGWFTDDHFAMPGAVEEHGEAHYGIALPQYWLGLIALASMAFVILFSFVYLKFVNPHHTDHGDR